MNNDKIQISITANSAKSLLMLATQQIDLLTTENVRLKYRIQELTEQCNEINNKLHEKEQHLNVGPSYEEMENALLTEQEHNGNLTKEVDRLTAILKERDAEIAKLRLMVPEIKPMQKDEYAEPYVFDECDKVVVGGMFFHKPDTIYIGKVLVVKDSLVRVEIEEGKRRGVYNIPYDYLAPLVEETK